jgi:hypothetical protein
VFKKDLTLAFCFFLFDGLGRVVGCGMGMEMGYDDDE